MGRLRLTVSKETGMAEGTLRGLGPAFEVESDEAVESATSDSDDSFDGFQPGDVDDAEGKGPVERIFWNRLGPLWGEISETMTCKSGYLWMT